jgi:hypothetical protein
VLTLITPILVLAINNYKKPIDMYLTRGTTKSALIESGRWPAVKKVLSDLPNAPFIGVGLGKFGKNENAGQVSYGIDGKKKYIRLYPHNVFLEVLAELGLLGMIFFIISFKPGAWIFNTSGDFTYILLLCFLFSLSSGDLTGNPGLFIFSYIARIATVRNKD